MNSFLQSLKMLGPARLAAMGAVGLALIGFFVYLATRLTTPSMELLYQDMALKDANKIVSELESQNIPYQLKDGGSAVYVPGDQVERMRVSMAEQGLPAGGNVGYEIFNEGGSLRSTSFVQNVNLMRALEGELSRTITSINGVKSTRVHLVLPRRQLFSRNAQQPSASIVLHMDSGKSPGNQQVTAVQHMVAAAVPKLEPDRVSVVDSRGNLLSDGAGTGPGAALTTAEELRLKTEDRLSRAIETLLGQSVGFDKVRAQVSVDMDLSSVSTREESFNPDERVVRSTQTIEEEAQSTEQEPRPVTAEENLPQAEAEQQQDQASARSQESRSEETVNYEISRTVRELERQAGVVKRISVAVLVDGTYAGGGGDEAQPTYEPRTEEEMQKLEALARSTIGYNAERGDRVEVINMRFSVPEGAEEQKPDLIMGFERAEVLRIAEILVLSLVAILVILLVVRPLVTKAFESLPSAGESGAGMVTDQSTGAPALTGPGAQAPSIHMREEEEEPEEDLIDLERVEGRVKASSIKKIGDIVEKHPEEALSIIRNWLYQEST